MWGCDESEIPGKGIPAQEIIEAIHAGEIKGLLSICFNPAVSAPDTNFTAEALDRLEFYAVIDFFLSETAQHADVVLPGSLHEEDEGTSTSVEGRIIKINAAVDAARRGPPRLGDPARHRRAASGAAEYFPYATTEEIFEELRVASRGRHRRLRRHHLGAHRGRDGRVLADPRGRPPRHAAPVRGRPVLPPRRQGPLPRACPFKESAEVVDDEYPVWLTTGRVVSQYLSGTQTRRIAGLVDQYPEPLCEMHPRLAEQLGIADGDLVTVTSRRGAMTLPANVVTTIRPDTVFIPYHWPGAKAANQLTNRAVDPVSKMPEFKVAAVRVTRAATRRSRADRHDGDA